MKIDITPTIEIANEYDKITIEGRAIDALYVFRYANGYALSVKFDTKSIAEFQPSRTVSEMMVSWEENIKHRYEVAKLAVKTKLHPTRTFERPIMQEIVGMDKVVREIETGETETVRSTLDSYSVANYKFEMNQLKDKFGAIKFCKIIVG